MDPSRVLDPAYGPPKPDASAERHILYNAYEKAGARKLRHRRLLLLDFGHVRAGSVELKAREQRWRANFLERFQGEVRSHSF
jgi:hypothetical protein